jgi:hypothetical protein
LYGRYHIGCAWIRAARAGTTADSTVRSVDYGISHADTNRITEHRLRISVQAELKCGEGERKGKKKREGGLYRAGPERIA